MRSALSSRARALTVIVILRTFTVPDRVLLEVEDEFGGLPWALPFGAARTSAASGWGSASIDAAPQRSA